jgi:hypothetical protein
MQARGASSYELKKKTGRGLVYTGLFNPKSRPPLSREKDACGEQNRYQINRPLRDGFLQALLCGKSGTLSYALNPSTVSRGRKRLSVVLVQDAGCLVPGTGVVNPYPCIRLSLGNVTTIG